MNGQTYTHFTLETLAPGVYAAIATAAGAAYSNAGVIDLATAHWSSTRLTCPRLPKSCALLLNN